MKNVPHGYLDAEWGGRVTDVGEWSDWREHRGQRDIARGGSAEPMDFQMAVRNRSSVPADCEIFTRVHGVTHLPSRNIIQQPPPRPHVHEERPHRRTPAVPRGVRQPGIVGSGDGGGSKTVSCTRRLSFSIVLSRKCPEVCRDLSSGTIGICA